MKLFARIFFLSGALLGIYIAVYPTALKFVAVPAGKLESGMNESVKDHRTVAAPEMVESIDLVVNGEPYTFKLTSLNPEYIYNEAKAFCIQQSASLSMSGDALERGCTQVVKNNILLKVKEKYDQAALPPAAVPSAQDQPLAPAPSTVYQVNVPVTNGKTYAISFDAAVHDPFQVSEHFCRENAAALGLEQELQIQQGCIPSVGKYIAEQLASVGFVRQGSNQPGEAEAQAAASE